MYAPFFGLEHAPFSIAPDPRYLFMSDRHREALAHLLYGLDAGGGFVLLTGEIGTGKTTVCRCFLEQIPAHCNVAYIFNPKLTVGELLRSICDEFGVAHAPAAPGAETVKDCLDPLNAFLLAAIPKKAVSFSYHLEWSHLRALGRGIWWNLQNLNKQSVLN